MDWLLRRREDGCSVKGEIFHDFDRLCEIAHPIAQPIVYEALKREVSETSGTGAAAWLSEAEQVLRDILTEPSELEGLNKEALYEELTTAMRRGLVLPTPGEADDVARHLVGMMISGWLEILAETLSQCETHSQSARVELTSDLLPLKEMVEPELWRDFAGIIAPFAINEAEAKAIREGIGQNFRETFIEKDVYVALPFNLKLKPILSL